MICLERIWILTEKNKFSNGNRVIVEGVQIADGWLSENKDYYSGKPTIILGTNQLKSMKRAFERDDRGNLVKGIKNLDNPKEYVNWYLNARKNLNEMVRITNAKRGKEWVKKYLSK